MILGMKKVMNGWAVPVRITRCMRGEGESSEPQSNILENRDKCERCLRTQVPLSGCTDTPLPPRTSQRNHHPEHSTEASLLISQEKDCLLVSSEPVV